MQSVRSGFLFVAAIATVVSFPISAQNGPVLWGLVPNAPPTTYVDAAGKPTGFFVDLYSRIMDELGIRYEFRIGNFMELYPRLVSGEIDFFTTLVRNPERDQLFVFPEQGFTAGWSQLFVAQNTMLQSVLDLQHKRIGVVTDDRNGTSFRAYVDSLGIPCEIVEYPGFDELVRAVADGEVFGGVQSNWFVSAEKRIQPTTVVFAPFKSYPVLSRKSSRRTEFDAIIARYGQLLADPRSYYFELQRKWLGHERTETTVVPVWLVAALLTLLAAAVVSACVIRALTARLRKANQGLERKVEERSRLLVRSEKMAALGTLVAGLAHELNSPLQALRLAADGLEESPARDPGLCQSEGGELFDRILECARTARLEALADTRLARASLARRLAAAGIEPDASTTAKFLDLGMSEPDADTIALVLGAPENVYRAARDARFRDSYLAAVRSSLGKIDTVVQALRIYTHQDQRGVPTVADLGVQIDAVLALQSGRIGPRIYLVRDYAGLPSYRCYADRMQQVWMALAANAIDNLEGGGVLTVRGGAAADGLRISFEDSGPGIPPELAARVFEPFFTIKPEGLGSGLGLAAAREIVRTHRGSLEFESAPGRTVFTVFLPSAGVEDGQGSAGASDE